MSYIKHKIGDTVYCLPCIRLGKDESVNELVVGQKLIVTGFGSAYDYTCQTVGGGRSSVFLDHNEVTGVCPTEWKAQPQQPSGPSEADVVISAMADIGRRFNLLCGWWSSTPATDMLKIENELFGLAMRCIEIQERKSKNG